MPCLNEAETVGACVRKARDAMAALGVPGEVVIADNGSTDGSRLLAESAGALVIPVPVKGYGSALQAGCLAARGRYLIMGDSDDSYDFSNLAPFLERLRAGDDLVMGSRFKGGIAPGAMPWHHRWIGNPVLTGILNLLFKAGISDAHCGMRGFSKEAFLRMNLRTTGMEFASEMVVKAAKRRLKISEVPITLQVAGRTRPPHLRSFRDGWRHLRFMLIYSPTALYGVPGWAAFLAGGALMLLLAGGPRFLGTVMLDYHLMTVASALMILGMQTVLIGRFARVYAVVEGFDEGDAAPGFSLERVVAVGGLVFLAGLGIDGWLLARYLSHGFTLPNVIRPALMASTLMILGAQVVAGSFFLGMMLLSRQRPALVQREA